MKKILLLPVVGVISATSFGQFYSATNIWNGYDGVKADRGGSEAFDTAYSNVTTFSGSGQSLGLVALVSGSNTTRMRADDLTVDPSQVGKGVTTITFSTVNFNAPNVTASPILSFYDDNAGVPGALLTAIGITPLTMNGTAGGLGNVQLWTLGAPSVGTWFTIPASGKLWAGISFNDNGQTTGITTTQLGSLGWAIFNPPTVGSSTDVQFRGNTSGPSATNNPTGDLVNFGGNPVANFGWQLQTVPEPASFAVIGLGLLGLARRRRSSK